MSIVGTLFSLAVYYFIFRAVAQVVKKAAAAKQKADAQAAEQDALRREAAQQRKKQKKRERLAAAAQASVAHAQKKEIVEAVFPEAEQAAAFPAPPEEEIPVPAHVSALDAPRAAETKAGRLRRGNYSLKSAVVFSEILQPPRALRGPFADS